MNQPGRPELVPVDDSNNHQYGQPVMGTPVDMEQANGQFVNGQRLESVENEPVRNPLER